MPKIYVLLIVLGGIGAILVGIPYLNGAFWYKETDPAVAGTVAYWGDLSYQIGIALLMLAGTLFIRNTKLQRVIISSMLATIFLMQIPPIFSWWTFNGSVLTENAEPAVEFKANWGYSIPHIILLLVALLSLYLLNRGRPKREDTS